MNLNLAKINQPDLFSALKKGNMTAKELENAIANLSREYKNALGREKLERERKAEYEKQEQKRKEKERITRAIKNSVSMDLPLDYENAFAGDTTVEQIHAESISDGLILSLSNLGKVDIEYISLITGETHKKVITTLKGSIFQNPETWEECFYKGWETADEYLTGNLVRKFNVALKADNKYKGVFAENVNAISRILPPTATTEDIFVTLGSPWIPADIIDDFIEYALGRSYCSGQDYAKVKHDDITGTWEIPEKNRYPYYDPRSRIGYGTKKISALQILEKTLNMKSVAAFNTVSSSATRTGTKQIIDKAETTLALEKQRQMIDAFQKWIWKDDVRKERLLSIYDEKYACFKRRKYDGSFLTFPTMDKSIQLYPYQKNAVARILFSKNTLLAHDVGAGKTYIMIAAGMEMKRMGISNKNMYVVPNNIVGQWKDIFLSMYKNANLLVVEPKNFTPAKREKILKDIKYKDYDGIIIAASCFEMIPLSRNYYIDRLEARRSILEEYEKNPKKLTSAISREKKKVLKELQEIITTVSKKTFYTYFDELGVTRLFIDEAHNYKNVPVKSNIDHVIGLSLTGSKKCEEMLEKVHFVQKTGGVIMATGTPITNSITDAYVMQLYLQSAELDLLDIRSFDAWVGMFAERRSEFEIGVDTSEYRMATRFSKFHNLSELTSILSMIADFHCTKKSADLPEFNGYKDCLLAKTDEFADYLKSISRRADEVRSGSVNRKDDNMLMITTDGRKAALDLRLADDKAKFDYNSKVYRCAENVFRLYSEGYDDKLTQLVFCDISTPKSGFNIYDELKSLLVGMGVRADEIEFIHDATTESKRNDLFEKMRKGEIRVLIGSTFKLGLGVNVQDKLIAIHHLDIPWRPADMVQREGRIIRPGNTNKEVYIYRYITEGSFDAYSWQLLETKQGFISALLSGSLEDNDGLDIQDTVLNYAEVKALAIGNPLVKERVETANELTRLKQLQAKTIETKENLIRELALLPKEIEDRRNMAEKCRQDLEFYREERNRRIAEKEENNRGRDEKEVKAESKSTKDAFNSKIYSKVLDNILKTGETYLTEFLGFKIVLPANMIIEKPYVYLERTGRYYVELGESEKGVMIRLYNCLEKLDERYERYMANLQESIDRQSKAKEELAKDVDYSGKIRSIKEKLDSLDKKLGVTK